MTPTIPRGRGPLRLALVALLVIGIHSGVPGTQTARAVPLRNVVLVGWDGVQRAHFDESLAAGRLPAARSLIEVGGRFDLLITDHWGTETNPGFATILTGISATDTGNVDNPLRYRRPLGEGMTLFERIRRTYPAAKVGWFSGKPYTHVNAGTTYEGLIDDIPGYPSLPFYQIGRLQTVARSALDLVEGYDFNAAPLLLFVHLPMPDTAGHHCGENSRTYEESLSSTPGVPPLKPCPASFDFGTDYWTGRLIDALKARGQWEQTLFLVVTDHGFIEGKRGHTWRDPTQWPDVQPIFLLANDPDVIVRQPEQVEIAGGVLTRLGLDQEIPGRVCNSAFEFPPAPCWALGGNRPPAWITDKPLSWRAAMQTDSTRAGQTAWIEQALTPGLPPGAQRLQVVAYVRPQGYGDTGEGQELIVYGTPGGLQTSTEIAPEIAAVRFGAGSVTVRARGAADGTVSEAIPLKTWARVKLQVETAPDGITVTAQIKWDSRENIATITLTSSEAVSLGGVRLGDTQNTGPAETSGTFIWDDVRALTAFTANDLWVVRWGYIK